MRSSKYPNDFCVYSGCHVKAHHTIHKYIIANELKIYIFQCRKQEKKENRSEK